MKTYEIFSGEELNIAELIQQRRLQMLIHSCIYYEMDNNVISDKTWGEWAFELKDLQEKYPEISKQVVWADAFSDWDGTTGAFLPLKDEWVVKKAKQILGVSVVKPKPKKGSGGKMKLF